MRPIPKPLGSDCTTPPPLLEVRSAGGGYGAVTVLNDVSLAVHPGELVAVLGANGAGKTTLLRLVTGLIPHSAGRTSFGGDDITKAGADLIVRSGLSMVPEGREIFGPLSVHENLMLGAYSRRRGDRSAVEADLERVHALFPVLRERHRQKAGNLSGGQQQMLAIGRALMAAPRMLLLDEPSLGLSPRVTQEIFAALRELNGSGLTMVLIEQNAGLALRISDRAYVMRTGRMVLHDTSANLAQRDLDQYYLGD